MFIPFSLYFRLLLSRDLRKTVEGPIHKDPKGIVINCLRGEAVACCRQHRQLELQESLRDPILLLEEAVVILLLQIKILQRTN